MPGSVSVVPGQRDHADHQKTVRHQRDVGEQAEEAVADDHEDDDRDERRQSTRSRRRGSKSWPRLGPTVRSSTIVEVGGERAGAQQHRRFLRALDGEVASIRPDPPRIASRITRRGDVFVVEHDGKATAHILLRRHRRRCGRRAC